MKQKLIISLCILIYLLLTFALKQFPPALNADEAAFGYNAYSLAKTGRDEYGALLPLRLKSFGDYKLPLYSYLSIPFIKIFGLNEFSTRLLAKFMGLILIILIYYLTLRIFNNKTIALISIILASVSPWIYLFSYQAHETTLATVFVGLSLLFLLKSVQEKRLSDWGLSLLTAGLSLFSYHSAKVIFPFLFGWQLICFFKIIQKKNYQKSLFAYLIIVFSIVTVLIFGYGEIKMPAERVKNLLLFNHQNIDLITQEAKTEARFSPYGQKVFISLREFSKRYFSYFSPEFLVVKGDANPRFGYSGISPLNYIEYLFFIIGLYYLFKKKINYQLFILLPLFIFPLASSLSWQEYSLSRTHGLILAILPLCAFGFYYFFQHRAWFLKPALTISVLLSLTSLYFLQVHYPQRAYVTRSWQTGYKELVQYCQKNYHQYNRFYITSKNGQPYIFFLFYLQYPPHKYQAHAKLSAPDEYGFGQVKQFDKYIFEFKKPTLANHQSYIGFPDDFSNEELVLYQFTDIIKGTETIFKIVN